MGILVADSLPTQTLGPWYVLHTKSRQEKALSDDLVRMDVGHFLPLVTQVKFYGKRKFKVAEPLFPGYLFVRGSLEQVYLADRTKRVASILQVVDQSQIDWELRNLHFALRQSVPLIPYPSLQKGAKVEVKSGPLRGLQGVIDSRHQDRLVLAVQMLGRAVSLEMDGSLLEPIEQ